MTIFIVIGSALINTSKMENDFYYGGGGIIGQKVASCISKVLALLSPYFTVVRTLIVVVVFQVLIFAQLYYSLPWILWKQIVTDICLLLSVPLYITMFVNVFGDIWDFCQYEKRNLEFDIQKMDRDSYFEVWEDSKYYPYVHKEDCAYVYCSVGAYAAGSPPDKESLEIDAVLEEERRK